MHWALLVGIWGLGVGVDAHMCIPVLVDGDTCAHTSVCVCMCVCILSCIHVCACVCAHLRCIWICVCLFFLWIMRQVEESLLQDCFEAFCC